MNLVACQSETPNFVLVNGSRAIIIQFGRLFATYLFRVTLNEGLLVAATRWLRDVLFTAHGESYQKDQSS